MLAAGSRSRTSRPKGPALLQVVLALGVAVLLAAVTLTTRQSPPPAIAEFAPQAAEQIKEQPKEQASQFGSGNGPGDCPPGAGCASGTGPGTGQGPGAAGPGTGGGISTTTTTSPKPPPATTKRCIGDPPRQIEDPQSPPCVAYWDDSHGNGGATAPGVTADSITIAAPVVPSDGMFHAFENFFNNRFELYGRRVRYVSLSGSGVAGADDAKQKGAFASLPAYNDIPYYRELAHNKIIGTYRTADFSDKELADQSPYIWSYAMSFTQMSLNLGDWACHRLAGQKATHAGKIDAGQLSDESRKFAILMDIGTADASVSKDVLKSTLEACGAKVAVTDTYPRFDEDQSRISNEILQMKANHVTTVFCLCVSGNLQVLQTRAAAQTYEPEWLISNYPQLYSGEYGGFPQVNRILGLSFTPMERVKEDTPSVWAAREGDPANAQANTALFESIEYRGWLLLMSGIQMAGPNLTPETFRAALQRTKFPNPDHPIMAGKVGFQSGTGMTIDGAEFWISYTDNGPYSSTQQATFCWVDHGRRHARGTWTTGGDPFQHQACDSGDKPIS